MPASARSSFDDAKLLENARAFVDAIQRAKPTGAKGTYLKKAAVSSSMGPGVKVDVGSLAAPAAGATAAAASRNSPARGGQAGRVRGAAPATRARNLSETARGLRVLKGLWSALRMPRQR